MKLFEAPAGQHWRWKAEPMLLIGGALLTAAITKSTMLSIATGIGLFGLLGWRLEPNKDKCPACGSMIPEGEAADLRRVVYVRRDELEALLAKPPPARPS